MKKIILIVFVLNNFLNAQIIFEENFEYPAGEPLTNHGWTLIRNGTPIQVNSGSLNYSGYNSSGIGNSAALVDTGGQEILHTFPVQSSDSVYFAHIIQVNGASTDGGVYLYAGGQNTTIFSKRLSVHVKKDINDYLHFGIGKQNGINYINSGNTEGSTNLIIMKYKFNPGTNNDSISIWINPQLTGGETEPDRTVFFGTDATSISEIVLSQLIGSNHPPSAIIDGICISSSWQNIVSNIIDHSAIKTDKFVLNQNYPNPFNPKTTFSYYLPKSGNIEFNVYNVLGQLVASLISEKQSAGHHMFEWDAAHLTSSIYFYKLKTEEGVQIKKMQLLK